MESDNITICAALMAAGHAQPGQIARIMAIDLDHARSLISQVEENKLVGDPLAYLKPSSVQLELML